MDEVKWERWGILAGVVFVVLVVVGALIGGSPPKVTDSPKKIFDYFNDNRDALKVGSYLNGLAVVAFLWFLGSLFGRLRRAEGGAGRVAGIALTGGVLVAAVALVANAIGAFLALHPSLGAKGTYQLQSTFFAYLSFAAAVFVAATSVVALRTKLLPSWLAWSGAALAVLWLVAGAGVSSARDALHAIGFIAFLAWAVWVLYRAPEGASA
jgi:hypothetical protein